LLSAGSAAINALRLLDLLPSHPVVTLRRAIELIGVTKPTAAKCIDDLAAAGILHETTGKQRDRVYVYQEYLDASTGS
jgi:DNA-binding IclR family transcriptional regulator